MKTKMKKYLLIALRYIIAGTLSFLCRQFLINLLSLGINNYLGHMLTYIPGMFVFFTSSDIIKQLIEQIFYSETKMYMNNNEVNTNLPPSNDNNLCANNNNPNGDDSSSDDSFDGLSEQGISERLQSSDPTIKNITRERILNDPKFNRATKEKAFFNLIISATSDSIEGTQARDILRSMDKQDFVQNLEKLKEHKSTSAVLALFYEKYNQK